MSEGLVIGKQSQGLARMVNKRVDMLKIPAVTNNLTQTELMITKSGTWPTIRQLIEADEKSFINEFSKACVIIARDQGIKSWNDKIMETDAKRAYFFVKTYYSSFTLKEFKLSFELALVGALDEFLPKDRSGKADRNHYQGFSLDFISKILNAMRKRKQAAWSKAHKLIPHEPLEITEEDKAEIWQTFINHICKGFEEFRDKGELTSFAMPSMVVDQFKKVGLVDKIPEATQDDITKTKAYYLKATFIDLGVRKRILANPEDPRFKISVDNFAGSVIVSHWLSLNVFDLIPCSLKYFSISLI